MRFTEVSPIHGAILPRSPAITNLPDIESWADAQALRSEGIELDAEKIEIMAGRYKAEAFQKSRRGAMDALQPANTTSSIPVPVQFLQNWLPGQVIDLTTARLIDDFVGVLTTGQWSDEQIVQMRLELLGTFTEYGDYTNIPLMSWNLNFNYSTVVRFEAGLEQTVLAAERASRVNLSSDNALRQSAILQLEVARNYTGWYGFNNGANFTYGFLNAPGLPSYMTVPVGASLSTTWASKTYLEIIQDIISMVVQIRVQSQENINPEQTPMVLGLATNARDQLSKVNGLGNQSVMQWLNQTYPNIRVVSAPQLNLASGGLNVAYMYAETTGPQDMSTDGKAVFIQMVPAKLKTLGVQQLPKSYIEDFSNATAGIMCKRPYAVTRWNGI